jgi:5-methylcytosine-specific restriction enzyme subunit McrC
VTTIELQRETRNAIIGVLSRFSDVSAFRLGPGTFSQVSLHQNNSYYKLVLKICHLIYLGLLPAETGQGVRFVDPTDDETRMSSVFEEFIRVFYQTETTEFATANREDIRWMTLELDDLHSRYLPKMQTDITLRSPDRTLIIDAKYYKEVFSNFRGAEKIRSGNLYQMFSYVKNCEKLPEGPIPEGLLIYPSSEKAITLDYQLGGHRIRVGTVDLDQEWREIDARLHELISS